MIVYVVGLNSRYLHWLFCFWFTITWRVSGLLVRILCGLNFCLLDFTCWVWILLDCLYVWISLLFCDALCFGFGASWACLFVLLYFGLL